MRATELGALRRLRALGAGKARLEQHKGRLCISLRAQNPPSTQAEKPPSTLAQERQEQLLQAYRELEVRVVPRITVARLVALTHIPEKPVHAFLRAQRGVSLTVEHRQARAVSSSRQNPHPGCAAPASAHQQERRLAVLGGSVSTATSGEKRQGPGRSVSETSKSERERQHLPLSLSTNRRVQEEPVTTQRNRADADLENL